MGIIANNIHSHPVSSFSSSLFHIWATLPFFSESILFSDIEVARSDAGSMREEPDADVALLATFFHRFPIFAFHAGGRGEQGGRRFVGGGGGEGERD